MLSSPRSNIFFADSFCLARSHRKKTGLLWIISVLLRFRLLKRDSEYFVFLDLSFDSRDAIFCFDLLVFFSWSLGQRLDHDMGCLLWSVRFCGG